MQVFGKVLKVSPTTQAFKIRKDIKINYQLFTTKSLKCQRNIGTRSSAWPPEGAKALVTDWAPNLI